MVDAEPLDLDSLPASPETLLAFQALIADEASGAKEVAALMSHDPALAATVLALVNSAFYRLPEITDLKIAVAYLGLEKMERIIIAATVVNAFPQVSAKQLHLHWRRAYLNALMSSHLVHSRINYLSSSQAWTFGLLHDVGSLVAMVLEPRRAFAIATYREIHKCLLEDAEAGLGLMPSPLYGAMLCRGWRLPASVEAVCAGYRQRRPPPWADEEATGLLPYVRASSRLASLVLDDLNEGATARAKSDVVHALGCDPDEVDELIGDARDLLSVVDDDLRSTLRRV
ncbi:MAG: HD-like signal output (HDOD) protein [Myxococcota bacterium]|jgi:HD-like signal output (HDOD) protein